jgi:pyruvate/2-oxoglutarate dehydrogenase complex dihydrolipoamide acyltransferase (E2) component
MAIEVTIPRLGWNMEEGIFLGWLKGDGQPVSAGDPLFSLEGDKATQDVESLESGILRIPPGGPSEGEKVAVGAVIGYLVSAGETATFDATKPARPKAVPSAAVPENSTQTAVAARENSRLRISPRARRAARELAVDPRGVVGTGESGRIVERDIRAAASAVAPAVNARVPAQVSVAGARPPATGGPVIRKSRQVPVTRMRKTIAERMLESKRATAAVTITTSVDATNLVNLRQQFKAVVPSGLGPPITYTDIVIKLTALALNQHPMLNARWDGESIVLWEDAHIGIAVDTEAGLVVPVIRDVAKLTLRELAAASRTKIERARAGALTAADLDGGTFTVTNLGPMGIETFTPLINLPECAILGMGRIQKHVVALDDRQFTARDRMMLSLSFDHRVVDGAPAARFLQALGQLIENPSPWLLP